MHLPSITHLTGILPLSNFPPGFIPPPPTSLACTCPLLSPLRTQMGRLLPVLLLPSGSTFSVHRPPLRDGSKSHTSGNKALRVKGLVVPRLHLWVWLPLLLTTPLPHPHANNSPLPYKALASKSKHKGDRLAICCLSSARSLRSSSPTWSHKPFFDCPPPAFPSPPSLDSSLPPLFKHVTPLLHLLMHHICLPPYFHFPVVSLSFLSTY